MRSCILAILLSILPVPLAEANVPHLTLVTSGGYSSCDRSNPGSFEAHEFAWARRYALRLMAEDNRWATVDLSVAWACFSGYLNLRPAEFYRKNYFRLTDEESKRPLILRSLHAQNFAAAAQALHSLRGEGRQIYALVGHSYGGTAMALTARQIMLKNPLAEVYLLTLDAIDPAYCNSARVAFPNLTPSAGCQSAPPRLAANAGEDIYAKAKRWINIFQRRFPRLHGGPLPYLEDSFFSQREVRHGGNKRSNFHSLIGQEQVAGPYLRALMSEIAGSL